MKAKSLGNLFQNTAKLRKYNNVVEAANGAKIILKMSGTVVYELKCLPGNRIISQFSYIGFIFYLVLFSGYLYCAFVTYYEDQTILRLLHNTKLRRYGDDLERGSSLIFTVTAMILTPFRLNGNRVLVQKIVDIDMVIENTGYIIDYITLAKTSMGITLSQIIVYFIRVICIYVVLSSSISMPVEKMFQVCLSDSLALMITTIYCYNLMIFVHRFRWINETLCDMRARNSWEYKVYVRGKVPTNMVKVVELQERQVCEKIKTCAKVYSMLFDACNLTSRFFGISLLLMLMFYFNYIILYLFYFMEANAMGLFHDLKRYFDLLVYTFWEIAIALGIYFLVTVYSELTVAETKKTSFLLHEIINENFGTAVNEEAMQFSVQLLHQMPVFTVCGLFNLDYSYLQQTTRSISTYLVILLQFVTEKP